MTKVFNLRERPGTLQIFNQLCIIILTFAGVTFAMAVIGFYVGSLVTGQDFMSAAKSTENLANADPTTIKVLKLVQLFSMLSFAVTALVLPRIIYHTNPLQYTGLNRNASILVFLLALFAYAAFYPLLEFTVLFNLKMDLPSWMQGMEDWMRSNEDRNNELTGKFLLMETVPQLLSNILLMAVLPAICEELLFRGFIQRTIYNWWGRKHLAVILTAFIFSAFHVQFFGFLPRFLLGLLLGYLFLWSGDLKLSMIVHFLNNFTSTMLVWFTMNQEQEIDLNQPLTDYSIPFYFLSAAAGGGLLYLLYKQARRRPMETEENETVYRLPVGDVPWEKAYSTTRQYEAEIVAGKLEDAGIKAVIVNKQDSSYRSFGEIEVYVPLTFYQRAKEILG